MAYYVIVIIGFVVAFLYYRYRCIGRYEEEIELLNSRIKQKEYIIKKLRGER